MEFRYFALSDLMTGWNQYDWSHIEDTLKETGRRGNQLVMRVYSEYPGRKLSLPQFLIDEGVRVVQWQSPNGRCFTPDYNNKTLQRAMQEFIAAFGKKYDGDPRVAFITAGMLGMWGEWHNYPSSDLYPPKATQQIVMNAFAAAFKKTHILLRYPAGENNPQYAPNYNQPFGYHDDSFAWATLDTGKNGEAWFFMSSLKKAGPQAVSCWRTRAIGGEIRPELWKTIFTNKTLAKQQNFTECVRQTHATWLMDTGLFTSSNPPTADRVSRATPAVRLMGYELHVSKAELVDGNLSLTIENRGVAPFYYDWPIEVRYSAPNIRTQPLFPEWKLSEIMPGESTTWKVDLSTAVDLKVRIRIANPMPGGKPLRFANAEMNGQWLELNF